MSNSNKKETLISSKKSFLNLELKELYSFKDLFITLSIREYKVRYAQTFLGFIWALIQPIITVIIFTIIFGRAIKVDTGNVPYEIFALTGMTAWAYFAFVVSNSGKSLISDAEMIKKIYYPRLITPLSKALVGLIDFTITFVILTVLMICYSVDFSPNIIWLPFFILMVLITALGFGIWISALTIRYRDFQHITPFIIQIGLYATPIAYSSLYIPEKYLLPYYILNPMVGAVEGFRWCIIGQINTSPHPYIFVSFSVVLLIFISSIFYFKKTEKVMADII
ncbi:MAG: ABC transporter permease [Bacteroidota bacterium]|nr:ABC transporter permease [Bacteroidota bacterium]